MDYQSLESARQKYAKKLKTFIIIGVTLFLIPIIFLIIHLITPKSSLANLGFISLMSVAIFVEVIVIILAILFTYKDARQYKKLYKSYFVEQNMKKIFTDLHYDHTSGMPKSVLESTHVINTGDAYSSNDYTTAKYKDVAFSQADVTIQEESTDSDGNTHYTTIFKGRWMIFEFPKPFTFRLQVVEKWFSASRKLRKDKETRRKIERIRTESIEFDKRYKVYAEDGFEAYYILDPAFLSHIEDLGNSHKGKLMLAFIDNKLHVALNDGNDAFEPPSPFKKLDEKTESAKIHHDIKTITDFVDFLKLDRKLFKN